MRQPDSYLTWHRYRKQVILAPSLFSLWACSDLLGRAYVYSKDYNRWFWDLIRHSEQRGVWICRSIATCGSMNTMSRNVENGSLNGEAEHWSLVLGYCTNHRATLLVERKQLLKDCSFFLKSREGWVQVQENRGCRLPLWRKAPLSSSDCCSVTWRVLGFTVFFCVILYYGSPGYFFFFFWALGFHLRDWESPSAAVLSIMASQTGICFLFLFVLVLY